jgi:hypothetical protein
MRHATLALVPVLVRVRALVLVQVPVSMTRQRRVAAVKVARALPHSRAPFA